MNKEIFSKCIKVLKTSSSDNEILAALLMVTKVLKEDDCNLKTVKEIFHAVGIHFLKRLIKTGGTPEDCSNLSFKSVAVSILSCFCAVKGFVTECHLELCELLPDLVKMTNIKQESIDDADTGQKLMTDCYDCLMCIAMDRDGRKSFISTGCVPVLCQTVTEQCFFFEKGLHLLLFLCQSGNHRLWKDCEDQFTTLVDSVVSKMELEKSDEIFDLCRKLSILFSSVDKKDVASFNKGNTLVRLHSVLFVLLQNKLGREQRCTVLHLCTMATEWLGVPWVLGGGEGGHKFLLLMVHLSCIEVRMNLDMENKDQVVACSSHLSSCYSLLELVIEYMTAGPSLRLDDKQVAQLHSAMVGAFNAVIQFLDEMSNRSVTQDLRPLVVASVRVLGSWIAEETTALRKEVLEILPFLIETGRDSFHLCLDLSSDNSPDDSAYNVTNHAAVSSSDNIDSNLQLNDSGDVHDHMATAQGHSVKSLGSGETMDKSVVVKQLESDPMSSKVKVPTNSLSASSAREEVLVAREFRDVDVLQFLMPGLCHLSAEDSARKILLTSNLTQLLYDYIVYQWRRLQSSAGSLAEVGIGKEPVVVMTTTCGVVLNIVVSEAHLVGMSSQFEEMFNFLADCLSKLAGSGDELVTLQYNLMLIGMMIIRRRLENQALAQTRMDDFFSISIKLMRQAHVISSSKKGADLTLEYHSSWPEFAELWYLAIQVLCECASYLEWLPKTVLASKWLPRVCKMLQDVQGNSVPEDIATAYHSLFLTLASRSATVIKVLKDCGAIHIARKYKTDVSSQLEEIVS